MITAEMKETCGEQTCLDLDKLDTRFLGCLQPTTLAALIVALTSAPDTKSDADLHIRNKLVADAWEHLESLCGVYDAIRVYLQPHHCGVQSMQLNSR